MDESFLSRSGLRVTSTMRADSPVFRRFFDGYDAAFVLPDEKEDEDGFAACLALNQGEAHARLVDRYGPFTEICLIADDAAAGAPAGGANLIAMPIGDTGVVTANLNYIFVDTAARGSGYFARLFDAVTEAVARLYPSAGPPLIFIEQNDPFAMSAEAYAHDTRHTGLDQIDRLRIWAKRGAKVVDFPYAQPPLSAEQEADATLVYSVLGAGGDALEACVLEGHLRRFFGISVLKGAPLESQPEATRQIGELRRRCQAGGEVALFDPAPLLAALTSVADAEALLGASPSDFLSALALWPPKVS